MPETPIETAETIAERLRQLLAEKGFRTEKGLLNLTVSLGVSHIKPDDTNIDMVIDRADQALYLSKQNGRNRVSTV